MILGIYNKYEKILKLGSWRKNELKGLCIKIDTAWRARVKPLVPKMVLQCQKYKGTCLLCTGFFVTDYNAPHLGGRFFKHHSVPYNWYNWYLL